MRLSTDPDRDDERAIATLHAALDAGVTLLDTADAYCLEAGEAGHNERLIARALASWTGDRSAVRVATKGGLTRPGGRWAPDGRARAIRRYVDDGWLALGVCWHPEVARGAVAAEQVAAILARTHDLLGACPLRACTVPTPRGRPSAGRKPLPGLGVELIERHRLDPAQCIYVGRDAADEAFARALGFTYRPAGEVFAPADPVVDDR